MPVEYPLATIQFFDQLYAEHRSVCQIFFSSLHALCQQEVIFRIIPYFYIFMSIHFLLIHSGMDIECNKINHHLHIHKRVRKSEVLPGISDHSCVLTKILIRINCYYNYNCSMSLTWLPNKAIHSVGCQVLKNYKISKETTE